MINSRNKGANFEREIGNLLVEKLQLKHPVKRILEQTRTKQLPDLRLGRWSIECKRYGDGSEPLDGGGIRLRMLQEILSFRHLCTNLIESPSKLGLRHACLLSL